MNIKALVRTLLPEPRWFEVVFGFAAIALAVILLSGALILISVGIISGLAFLFGPLAASWIVVIASLGFWFWTIFGDYFVNRYKRFKSEYENA